MSISKALVLGVVVTLEVLHLATPAVARGNFHFDRTVQSTLPVNHVPVDFDPATVIDTSDTSIISSSGFVGDHHVINGWEPENYRFRYMASLQLKDHNGKRFHVCGAVLVSPLSAITAAHCLIYYNRLPHYVALGHQRLTSQTNTSQDLIKVQSILVHPNYNTRRRGAPNDIAIVYFERPVQLSEDIQLADLAVREDGDFENALCEVVGWGTTEDPNYYYADELRAAYLIALSNYQCELFLRIFRRPGVHHSHICGWLWPFSSCYGDSGGPLVCWGKVVGITSWAPNCSGCFPQAFTRVSSYEEWLLDNI